MITQLQLDEWFTYHPPTDETVKRYNAIRAAGREFAEVVLANTPPCADQTVAVRRIREAVAVANAAVACDGK